MPLKHAKQTALAAVRMWDKLDALLLRSSRTREFAAGAVLAATGMWVLVASVTTAMYSS